MFFFTGIKYKAALNKYQNARKRDYKVYIKKKGCQFLKYNTDSDKRLLVYYFVICMSPLVLMVYMATILLIVSCSLALRWGVKWEK